jgi:hypothetical protein
VQITYQYGELENSKVVDAKGHDDAYITKMCLENLHKQRFFLKPHYYTSFTWAFFKVNNNQLLDLKHNQIMKCIICHHDYVSPKILVMHTRCKTWKDKCKV